MATVRKRKPSVSPRAILLIAVVTATAIFIGGLVLSRRDDHVHVTTDRKPIQSVGEEMEQESAQLQRTYEKHLRHLALVTMSFADEPQRISAACDAIVGVAQWSLVYGAHGSIRNQHQLVDPTSTTRWPKPTFAINPDDPTANDLVLSEKDLLHSDGTTWGWIANPGAPLLFWQRTDSVPTSVVVLTIDPQPLDAALSAWFKQWAQEKFAPLRVRNGAACALTFGATTLASTGTLTQSSPDFVLPVRSFFGTWEISAWDPVIIRTHYDYRVLATAGFLSVLIVVLGVLAYGQQQRLLAETAQQVTFVNRVSHELRSPLTNILLNLELGQEMLSLHDSGASGRLSLVQEEALRLRRLVDNVLAFSSLDQDKYRWERRACAPDELVRTVIEQFAPAFQRRGLVVRFTGNASTPCLLDADAVAQILANLLSNIEKYVPPGEVEITTDLRNNLFTLVVKDEGAGVPQAESERVFQPFQRLDGRINEGSSGTGLGLSIARDLALGMGGSLRLMPSRVGATFELCVPAFPCNGAVT